MATIHFSRYPTYGFLYSSSPGSIASGSASASIYAIAGTLTADSAYLIIYKGSVPSFPSFTDRSSRSSDELIVFPLTSSAGTNNTTISGDFMVSNMGYRNVDAAAAANGAASWFLFCRANTTSLTSSGGMIGTVGLPGSGADLEIPNVNIVQGQNYQSLGVNLRWPLSHTV